MLKAIFGFHLFTFHKNTGFNLKPAVCPCGACVDTFASLATLTKLPM
jgi:hypothetical protein